MAVKTRSRKLLAKLLKGPTQLPSWAATKALVQMLSWMKGLLRYPQHLNYSQLARRSSLSSGMDLPTFCCTKLCDSCDCWPHVIPRFALVCSVENQISTPMTSVSKAVSAIRAPVIFNQIRLEDRAAPGRETRKVTKVITPAAMTPKRHKCQSLQCQKLKRMMGVPVKGVCISSMLAATLFIVGWLAMAAFVMKTTPINRPPEARNRKSWSRKTSSILLTMAAARGVTRWRSGDDYRSAVFKIVG